MYNIEAGNFSKNTTAAAVNSIYKITNQRLIRNHKIDNIDDIASKTDALLSIHGISKDKLNVIKNIENLIEGELSKYSIDENSNKNDKTMKGIVNESTSPYVKIIGYRYLYREMKELYGKKEAEYLTGLMYDYTLALSDSINILIPYSYYGNTPIIIKINNNIKFTTLKKLFNDYQEFSKFNKECDMDEINSTNIYKKVIINRGMIKDTRENFIDDRQIKKNNLKDLINVKHNIEIWDTKNGWVNVERIIRHKNNKKFITYQTEGGHFAVVTEDHPIYMNDGSEKQAIDLKIGDCVLVENELPINDILLNNICVDENLSYFLGFMLGDGNIDGCEINQEYKQLNITLQNQEKRYIKFDRNGTCITIYQKEIENTKIFEVAKSLFSDTFEFFKYNTHDGNRITFSSPSLQTLVSVFFEHEFKEKSYNKKLPENILEWDRHSLIALLSGLIDSDGGVSSDYKADLRMASSNIINQVYEICRLLGLKATTKRVINNLFFGISFKLTEEFLECCEKLNISYFKNDENSRDEKFKYLEEYSRLDINIENKIKKIFVFTKEDLSKKSFGKDELDFVYDITTSTGRFYANGMVQHNCWAFDASKIVTMGKPFEPLKSSQPHSVRAYIAILNEVIHQMSNHLAGAIAIGTYFFDLAHLMFFWEGVKPEMIKDKLFRKTIENNHQQFVHGVNSLSRSGGQESPFSNISLFDRTKLRHFIENDFSWYFKNQETMEYVYPVEDIVEFIIELQNIFMEFFDRGDPLQDGMPYRFPVATLNISKKKVNETWVVEDKKFLKACCKKDIFRYNIFSSEGSKVASCCRLLNDTEMIELASQANSFGGGSSISLGSHRVLTTNFVRLALEADNIFHFLELLEQRVYESKKILNAHKSLIERNKHLQVMLRYGWIQSNRMFSTFGILGIVECEQILKERFADELNSKAFEGVDLMGFILSRYNQFVNKESTLRAKKLADPEFEFVDEFPNCIFNIEQIPAESMSHRLAKADKIIFGDKLKYNIYANQWIPLWDNEASIWERIEKDGKYNSKITGGGIVHINTGEHITGTQAEELIMYAIEHGCEHFAITGTFCKCENNHITLGNKDICPICSKNIIQKVARVVGFFTPVSDWSYEKRTYDHELRKEYSNGDFDKGRWVKVGTPNVTITELESGRIVKQIIDGNYKDMLP